MTGTNPATHKPFRNQLLSEREEIHKMLQDRNMWDEEGEPIMVNAFHEAMRRRYGQIAAENKEKPTAMKSRMKSFRERLRLSLSGAKTEAQVRFAIVDLFSRSGNNPFLGEGWQHVLPVIRRNWQLARDLGLLALASYVGTSESENDTDKTDSTLIED